MQNEIEELQSRIAFHEDSIQELTRSLLDKQRQIDELKTQVEHLHQQLKSVMESNIGSPGEEAPPPHY